MPAIRTDELIAKSADYLSTRLNLAAINRVYRARDESYLCPVRSH